MNIWEKTFTLETLNSQSVQTMIDFLDIKFTKIGKNYLEASMPINGIVKQPFGVLHGGASCILAETVASVAANQVKSLANDGRFVGIEINANHIHSVKNGVLLARATPFHIGKTTQVWGISIKDARDARLICIARLTLAYIKP